MEGGRARLTGILGLLSGFSASTGEPLAGRVGRAGQDNGPAETKSYQNWGMHVGSGGLQGRRTEAKMAASGAQREISEGLRTRWMPSARPPERTSRTTKWCSFWKVGGWLFAVLAVLVETIWPKSRELRGWTGLGSLRRRNRFCRRDQAVEGFGRQRRKCGQTSRRRECSSREGQEDGAGADNAAVCSETWGLEIWRHDRQQT